MASAASSHRLYALAYMATLGGAHEPEESDLLDNLPTEITTLPARSAQRSTLERTLSSLSLASTLGPAASLDGVDRQVVRN